MFITVMDGGVIPIAKRYFSSISLRAMSGDLAGLIRANGAGKEAIRTEINARASSISSL
ncbi:hypothetical protein [Bacillus atrophaeus]|uniref:hypothetical protein n=1 Tax=Bacillus atrophaeus TaxID=1452 RepID=UPI001680DD2B|nr:hypothetical protein [Bacillus atrophaeus]